MEISTIYKAKPSSIAKETRLFKPLLKSEMAKLAGTIFFSYIFAVVGLSQQYLTFSKKADTVSVQVFDGRNFEKLFSIDTLFADECTIVGDHLFTLTRVNLHTSSPCHIFIKHYFWDQKKLELRQLYKIPPSIAVIQVKFHLLGGYLNIISKRAKKSTGKRPKGTILPFSVEDMDGEKKILNIPLSHQNLSNIESILIEFNDW